MNPVGGGTQKITMNSREKDYQERLAQAKGQQYNAFVEGVNTVFKEGPGEAIKNTRGPHGAPTLTVGDLLQGDESDFSQRDVPGNTPLADAPNQTGFLDGQTSSTNNPEQDPREMNMDALSRRLAMYKEKGYNAGLNNRANTGSLN